MSVWHKALAMTLTRTSPAFGGATVISSIESGFFASQAASGTIVSMSGRSVEPGATLAGAADADSGRGCWEEGQG